MKNEYPIAAISYGDDLFAIENYKTYPEDVKIGNPYNTSFSVRVLSDGFGGTSLFECDIKEFFRFVKEAEEISVFKRAETTFCDKSYGSFFGFSSDKTGHVSVFGEIYGERAEQKLCFRFSADVTCLLPFAKTLGTYIE